MQDITSNPWVAKLIVLADHLGGLIGNNTLYIVLWFFLFMISGFVIGGIFAIYLAKKRLLKRNNHYWNVLAKFSYILILLVMPLALGSVGAIYSVQRTLNQEIDEQLLPAITEQMPALSQALSEQLKGFHSGKVISVRDVVEPIVKDMYYIPSSDGLWEQSKARLINDTLLNWGARTLTEVVQRALLEKLEIVGEVLKANTMNGQASSDKLVKVGGGVIIKFMTDTTREVDFTQMEKTLPSMLSDAFKYNINTYFKSIYTMILLFIVGMALLIVGEILYYRRHLGKFAD